MDYSSVLKPSRTRNTVIAPQFTIRVADNGVLVETIANGQRTRVYPSFEEASEYISAVITAYYTELKKVEEEAANAEKKEKAGEAS